MVELDGMVALLGDTYSFRKAKVVRKIRVKIIHSLDLLLVQKTVEEKH